MTALDRVLRDGCVVTMADIEAGRAELAMMRETMDKMNVEAARVVAIHLQCLEVIGIPGAGLLEACHRLKKQETEWRANHDEQVRRPRLLRERPDLPIERTQAYDRHIAAVAEIVAALMEVIKAGERMVMVEREFHRRARTMPPAMAELLKEAVQEANDNYAKARAKVGL